MGITESKFDYLDDQDSSLAEQTDNESSVHSDVEILNVDDEISTEDEQPMSSDNQNTQILNVDDEISTEDEQPMSSDNQNAEILQETEPILPQSTQFVDSSNLASPTSIPQSTSNVEDLFDIAATEYNPREALERSHQRIDYFMTFISVACMALLLFIFFYEVNGHMYYKKEYEACQLQREFRLSPGCVNY